MTFPHRLFLLTLHLVCFGNLGVLGQDDVDPTALTSLSPSQPSSTDPPPVVQSSQTFANIPTPTRVVTYPPTPPRNQPDPAIPSSTAVSPFVFPTADASTALTAIQLTPFSVLRSTPPKSQSSPPLTQVPTAQSSSSAVPVLRPETTLPSTALRGSPSPSPSPSPSSMTTNFGMPTLALTTIPVVSPPSSLPQRCQLTFDNQYNDLKVTDYDLWTHRTTAQRQLAEFCSVPIDRITNIALEPNPWGELVLRFTIEQGWPFYTAQALQNLKYSLNTTRLELANQPLSSPVAVYWTDNGPCPNDTCLNNGTCDVTLSNDYRCLCDVGYTGPRCQDDVQTFPDAERVPGPDNRLLALLVLLVIPIAIAVIVGFIFGRRRQQKEQLKKAFDLRDVRTIGPRSMLSLPLGESVGIRNQMYDTRSFALAFTDTTFSKSSPTPSASNDDSASSGDF